MLLIFYNNILTADPCVQQIYEMAKLAIGGLQIQEISPFQNRTADLMGKLMAKVI